MARIKAEVKEHAQQQRLARQSQHQAPPPQLPTRAVVSEPSVPVAEPIVVKVEATSAPAEEAAPRSAAGCIDLTADEETEDEEDADEPFAPRVLPVQEGNEGQHVVSHPEPADAMDADTDEEMEQSDGRTVMRTDASTGSAAFAPAVDGDETDESEVDEEMPLARPERVESPQVDEPSPLRTVSVGVRAETPLERPSDGEATHRSEISGSVDGSYEEEMDTEDNQEEEEDEQWPELRPQVSPEEEKQHESPDEDACSTASEGEGGSVEGYSAGETRVVKTGNPLEDGEIFEEGAVVKSPTAVKEAIALELQARAAATTKKKQKKRGRKKNKRKADAMLPETPDDEDIDEFGRNVRHQPMPPAMPVTLPLHVQEFLPSMGIRSIPPPIPAGVHPPSLLPLPPGMAPSIPQGPPLPPQDFGDPHVPRQYVDDQIVRVNRHGGFEPFAFQGNRASRLPIAAPFLPPPRQPPPYRYVSLDYFSPERTDAVDSPNRGLKRPLPQPTDTRSSPVEDASEAMFDLDSLRAAALKTKRKTASTEVKAVAAQPPDSGDIRGGTNEVKDAPPPVTVVQAEEDPSLDALRMELLKSVRRKRREVSSQSATCATDSPSDPSSNKGVEVIQDTQVTPQEAQVAPALPPSEPLVPESPQFRPLTAMSQSIVIRLSLDDISAEQSKARADSYDDAAKRFDKVLDDIRTEAASTKTPVSLISTSQQPSVYKEKITGPPTVLVPSPEKQAIAATEKSEASKAKAGDVAAAGGSGAKPIEAAGLTKSTLLGEARPAEEKKAGVGEQQVVPKAGAVVDVDTLADPVKLEAERRACLENIREADTHIARLDAEIAALRLVITARDAEASSTSSSVTACGA